MEDQFNITAYAHYPALPRREECNPMTQSDAIHDNIQLFNLGESPEKMVSRLLDIMGDINRRIDRLENDLQPPKQVPVPSCLENIKPMLLALRAIMDTSPVGIAALYALADRSERQLKGAETIMHSITSLEGDDIDVIASAKAWVADYYSQSNP